MEKRTYRNTESRASVEGGRKVISGYAAVYNAPSHDLGGYVEVIRPGAFDASLAENPDVSARVQHAGGLTTIGRTRNGTLQLQADAKGLRYTITLPDTQAGRDIYALVRGGYIDKSSFAFTVRPGGERWSHSKTPAMRELLAINVHDVSPVDGPAYDATSAEARRRAADAQRVGSTAWIIAQADTILRQWREPREVQERRFLVELRSMLAWDRAHPRGYHHAPNPHTLRHLDPLQPTTPSRQPQTPAPWQPRTTCSRHIYIDGQAYELGRVLSPELELEIEDWQWGEYYNALPAAERERRQKLAGVNLRQGLDLCRTGRRRSAIYW